MKRFLKELFYFLKQRSYVDRPEWNAVDEELLRSFLSSARGRKLHKMLVYASQEQDRWATLQTKDSLHAAGFACGWRACVAHLEVLAGAPPDESKSEDGVNKGAAELDHLNP